MESIIYTSRKLDEYTLKNNLANSFDWFETFKDISLFKQNSFDEDFFQVQFGNKKAKRIEAFSELKFDEEELKKEKTAIVILGLSCTGKTNIALQLKEMYPSFECINFDAISAEGYMLEFKCSKDEILAEEAAEFRVSECFHEIASADKNLILDGNFIELPVRGAIIKTLEQYKYSNVIAVSTLQITDEEFEKKAQSRANIHSYFYNKLYNKKEKNMIDVLESSMELTKLNYAKEQMILSKSKNKEWKKFYPLILESYEKMHEREKIIALLSYQSKNELFKYGFNVIYEFY